MFQVKINDWYELHNGFDLTLNPGVTVLVGPNGAGKTTLLRQLREAAEAQGAIILSHDNVKDGGRAAKQQYLMSSSIENLAAAMTASEGEEVALNFGNFLPKIIPKMRHAKAAGKPLFVLIDGVDSGASIDRQRELVGVLNLIEKDCKNQDFYIVVTANNYEVAKLRCINPRTGEEVSFQSYEEYANYICDFFDKNKKQKRGRKSNSQSERKKKREVAG